MQKKVIVLLLLITTLCLSSSGQSVCSIYNQILNDIQSQVTKSKIVTITPPDGHDPENPIFIYDTLKNEQLLYFYIVKEKQDFNSATVKYWFSSFLNDTSLNSKKYQNNNNDSIINYNFNVKFKIIEFKDKLNFELTDYTYKKEKVEVVTYIPTKVVFSKILFSKSIALVFAKIVIGTNKREFIYGYIFKKENCNWNLEKRNIEIR